MLAKPIRLTIVYGLIWTVVLAGIILAYRRVLDSRTKQQIASSLAGDLETLRGYLRIERGHALWYYDHDDPSEEAVVSRLRSMIIISDAQGRWLERSRSMEDVAGKEWEAMQQRPANSYTLSRDKRGDAILLLGGQLRAEDGSPYYAFIGRPVQASRPDWLLLIFAAVFSFSLTGCMVRQSRA